MNNFAVEIWYDEAKICTFYTVRWISDDEDLVSETDQFFDNFAVSGHPLEEQAFQLSRLITESIGNKYGATDDFFDRVEDNAQALPPVPKQRVEEIKDLGINFPLRLFCLRISEKVVVLFNGGIKDADTAQESKNLSFKFYEAQTFAKRIMESLHSGMIQISTDESYLINFDGTKEIIL